MDRRRFMVLVVGAMWIVTSVVLVVMFGAYRSVFLTLYTIGACFLGAYLYAWLFWKLFYKARVDRRRGAGKMSV